MYIMIFVSQSIKFRFVIKMSWWINTKKCWKKQRRRTSAEGSAVWFMMILFFVLHRLRKTNEQKNKSPLKKKKKCLWSDFAHRTAPVFLSPSFSRLPLLVTPTVSSLHKKQETLWLCYHYSYKNMTTTGSYPAYFFCHLVTPQEARRGRKFGWVLGH